MKKFILSLGLGLALTAGAVSADGELEQLNTRVAEILLPYQNEATHAQLNFNSFEDGDLAVGFALNGLYSKTGSQNNFELKIDNFGYNQPSAHGEPMTIIKGSLGLDFTKLGTDTSQLVMMGISLTQQILQNYTEDVYGDAGSVSSAMTSSSKDANGDYTSATALFSAKIDLSRLSEEEKQSVKFSELVMSLSLDLKKGIAIDAYLINNPEYSEFAEIEQKLKEFFASLLSGDDQTVGEVNEYLQDLELLAKELVDGNDFPLHNLTKFFPKKS